MCDIWVGVSNVHHNEVKKNFNHFHLTELNRKGNIIWKGTWVAIIWSIWNQRNNVAFRKTKVDEEEILCLAYLRI